MTSEFIRLPIVLHLTGLKRTNLYKLMYQREFPQSISFGTRRIAWRTSEVHAWIESKIQARKSQ